MQNLRYCTGTTAVQVLHLVPLARGTTAVQVHVHVVNFQYRICTVPGRSTCTVYSRTKLDSCVRGVGRAVPDPRLDL